MKREEKSIVSEVLYDLESLGINAANQSLEQAVFTLLLSLSDLVRIADSEEHLDFIEWIGLSFCEIGKASAMRVLDTEVKTTINHSIQIIKNLIDHDESHSNEIALESLIGGLGEILIKVFENRNHFLIKEIVAELGTTGKNLAEKGYDRAVKTTLHYLDKAAPEHASTLISVDINNDVKTYFKDIHMSASKELKRYIEYNYASRDFNAVTPE